MSEELRNFLESGKKQTSGLLEQLSALKRSREDSEEALRQLVVRLLEIKRKDRGLAPDAEWEEAYRRMSTGSKDASEKTGYLLREPIALQGFPLSSYNPNASELEAIRKFLGAASPTRSKRDGERIQTLFKLAFDCGISNEKGFIAPAYLEGPRKIGYSGNGAFIDNLYFDDPLFYTANQEGGQKFVYNRRIKSMPLCIPDARGRMQSIYRNLFEELNGLVGRKEPFINLDIRIRAKSYEAIESGSYDLCVTDVNADVQDFLADFGSFSQNRLTEGTCGIEAVIGAMTDGISVGEKIAVVAPGNWRLRGFYVKELETLTGILSRQGFKYDVVDAASWNSSDSEKYPKVINYAAAYGIEGENVVPSGSFIEKVNDRMLMRRLLRDAGAAVPEMFALQSFKLNGKEPWVSSYEKFLLAAKEEGTDIARFEPLFVLKSRRQKQLLVQILSVYDSKSFRKVVDYASRGGAVIEELVLSDWARGLWGSGTSSEIKTLGIQS